MFINSPYLLKFLLSYLRLIHFLRGRAMLTQLWLLLLRKFDLFNIEPTLGLDKEYTVPLNNKKYTLSLPSWWEAIKTRTPTTLSKYGFFLQRVSSI